MLDSSNAKTLIAALKEVGIIFTAGLSVKEVWGIETTFKAAIPTDLKTFLIEGIPVNHGDEVFPNWHQDCSVILRNTTDHINQVFLFDIKENNYWHSSLGIRPNNDVVAAAQALAAISSWPPLFPIYNHRYMPSIPEGSGSPVISLWQATDSVYYGNDLVDYLVKEFHIQTNNTPPKDPKRVPIWSDVLGL